MYVAVHSFPPFVCLRPGLASGLEITTTGPTSIEKASGQSVKLDCQFTLAPEDSGPLDIEWSLLASDNQNEDKVVRVDVPHKHSKYSLVSKMAHESNVGSYVFSDRLLYSAVVLSMFREVQLCSCFFPR